MKDLSQLGRNMKDVVIIDNSPAAYLFHPENALPCTSWYDERLDTELFQFIPLLRELSKMDDVRPFLSESVEENKIDVNMCLELMQ